MALLSEVERVTLKAIGKRIVEDKDRAIEIMLSAVRDSVDPDTSLEFAGILAMAEGFCGSLTFKVCPSVSFYCETMTSQKVVPLYFRQMIEAFGWV